MDYLFVVFGFCLGAMATFFWQRLRLGRFETMAKQLLHEADKKAEEIKHQAAFTVKEQQLQQAKEFEHNWQAERKKMWREEERLKTREDKLEERFNLLEKKINLAEKRELKLQENQKELAEQKQLCEQQQLALKVQLEKAASLTEAEAKAMLFERLQQETKNEQNLFLHRAQEELHLLAENQATRLLTTIINRLAVSTTSEVTSCTVHLPHDEIKGRIIGREGRNIRALEKATGVNFLMDDTPQAIVISGFDPIRKAIAKAALTELIADGRIHPTRIEEATEKATQNVQKLIRHFGEDAALRIGAVNIHPELIQLLGKLKFRTSLGQNVLEHSLEVAHLMGLMAAELGLNGARAKRMGLLHDIGKAVSHEMNGSHALIGYNLALKWGEEPEIANGIGCHHFEMEASTLEGSLCSAADAISASRPGSRIEALDEYIKRLTHLEEIANQFPGVEKAYALQAGREIRVIALPDQISDEDVLLLARNLTKKIEQELHYQGKIKVSVSREKRVVDYAM